MVSRKTMLLALSVVGVTAVTAVMTVQAQDGQQSSRRTHRPAQESTPATTAERTPPVQSNEATPTPANPIKEPTVADPFESYSRGTGSGNATEQSTTRRSTANQQDPFARTAQRPEPRPFGGNADSQLPTQQSAGGSKIPGALTPDDSANALRPIPQQTPPAAADPFRQTPVRSVPNPTQDSSFGGVHSQQSPTTQGTTTPSAVDQGDKPFDRFAMRSRPRVDRGAALTGGASLFRQQAPSLVVETKGPEQVIVGREAVLRVQLFNEGDNIARDIALTMNLPSDVELTEAEPTGGRVQMPTTISQGMHWHIDSVNPGGGESLTMTVIPTSSQPLDLRMQWTTAPAEAVAELKVLEPKLQMAVTGPMEIAYGEKAIYTMTFSNPGTADAEDVEVMLMPLEPGGEPETHEIGMIAAGSKRDVEIELVPKQTGTLQIRAQASALGGLVANVAEDILIRRADIDVRLQGPNFRYAKTPATYRLHVTNPGNAPTSGLQVGAILPPGATFVSASHAGEEEEGGRVRWRLDQLPAGGEMYLELRCELAQAGPNRVEAVALADGELRAEHMVSTEVEALAELNLNVRDPRGPVPVGEETEYEIVISNRGTKAAERIAIMAYFSDGIEPVRVSGAAHQLQPGAVILGPLPVLPADDQTVIKVTAKAHAPGNHQFRVELICEALDTTLAEQKMTRFYGDVRQTPSSRDAARHPGVSQPQTGTGALPSSNASGDRYSNADRYSAQPPAGLPTQPGATNIPTPAGPQPTPADETSRYEQGSGQSLPSTDGRYGIETPSPDHYGLPASGQPTPAQQPAVQQPTRSPQPTPADQQ
ncbi:MAG: hypothetical protein MPJ50_17065 [Pirellulales bacterium]|nr:hypothetical protein [Pirellulales bacterium]